MAQLILLNNSAIRGCSQAKDSKYYQMLLTDNYLLYEPNFSNLGTRVVFFAPVTIGARGVLETINFHNLPEQVQQIVQNILFR